MTCKGLFRPGDKMCRLCDRDKSSHQTDHRGKNVSARSMRCRCGNDKSLRDRECPMCEVKWQYADEYRWLS